MKDKSDIDYKKLTNYILIALAAIAVLWLNYCSLDGISRLIRN